MHFTTATVFTAFYLVFLSFKWWFLSEIQYDAVETYLHNLCNIGLEIFTVDGVIFEKPDVVVSARTLFVWYDALNEKDSLKSQEGKKHVDVFERNIRFKINAEISLAIDSKPGNPQEITMKWTGGLYERPIHF